jgi:hypothetical protein
MDAVAMGVAQSLPKTVITKEQEEGKEQKHGAGKQQFAPGWPGLIGGFGLGLVLQDAALQQNGTHHRHAEQAHQQKRFPPAHDRHQQGDDGRCQGKAQIAGEGMHCKGAAHAFLPNTAG